jgi:hypothetical protein
MQQDPEQKKTQRCHPKIKPEKKGNEPSYYKRHAEI